MDGQEVMNPNQQPELRKPRVKLVGQDGNVFNLLGLCSKALKKAGQYEQAKQMASRVFAAGSYHEALAIMQEYVDAH